MPLMTSAEFAAKDGGCCPKCQEDTHLEYYGLDFESGAIYQEARCLECGFEWSDSYQISGYVSSEDEPEQRAFPMTEAEHKQRHVELHQALDELLADWITHEDVLPTQESVLALMDWSHAQTLKPTPEQ